MTSDPGNVRAVQEPRAEAVRTALLQWLRQQQQAGADASSAQAWLLQLAEDGAVWRGSGNRLVPWFAERLETIARLAGRRDNSPPPAPPPALLAWLRMARQICSRWPPQHTSDWPGLLSSWSQEGNTLLDATVAQLLAEGLYASQLPESLTAPLLPLLQPLLNWAKGFSIPPGPRGSWHADDYLLLDTLPAFVQGIETAVRAVREEITTACTAVQAVLQPSGRRFESTPLAEIETCFESADGDLLQLLADGRAGWPIEQAVLAKRCEAVLAVLDRLVGLRDPLLSSLRPQFESLATEFKTACRFPAADQPDRLSGVSPNTGSGAVAGLPCTPARDADPVPPLPSQADGCSGPARLRALAASLAAARDPHAGPLARRLDETANAWQAWDSARSAADAGQTQRAELLPRLLGCLVFLDQLVADGDAPVWLRTVREELRRLLGEEGTYAVLDAELIGADLLRRREEAAAVGRIASKTVKPGHIAAVKLPGYAVRRSDGTLQVIQKAQVWLAR